MKSSNKVLENILSRRNTKPNKFNGKTVDNAVIQDMLKAAHWAPTHGHTEPWHFVVFTGEGKTKLFNFLETWLLEEEASDIKINKIKERILKSSHIIGIGMKRGDNPKIPEIEELISVSMAVQNMWLVAANAGKGVYWGTGEKAFKNRMKSFLGLSEKDKSLGFLYIGELDSTPLPGQRLSKIEDHVKWIDKS